MKKNYSEMSLVIIPINSSLEASGNENCIEITTMETSVGSTQRCDLTDPSFVQNRWFGNVSDLPLTYSVSDCYPIDYADPTPDVTATPEITILPEITPTPEVTVIPDPTVIPETTGMP